MNTNNNIPSVLFVMFIGVLLALSIFFCIEVYSLSSSNEIWVFIINVIAIVVAVLFAIYEYYKSNKEMKNDVAPEVSDSDTRGEVKLNFKNLRY